ncbi:MAG: hypothetical protein IKG58_02125 [Bacilli bacterium]|nr:hypothetical protein [Bacilli bacterium]
MNENIGAIGGSRDRKRRLLITREQKKKLKRYNIFFKKRQIMKMEKAVRKQQVITFFKATPIMVTGSTFRSLFDIKEKTLKKVVKEKQTKTNKFLFPKDKNNVIELIIIKPRIIQKEDNKKNKNKKEKPPIKKVEVSKVKKIDNLKNKELLVLYENKFKTARRDLKELEFENKLLSDETKKDKKGVYDNLDTLIHKVNQLEDKYKVEDISEEEQEQIKEIAEKYISDFKDKKEVHDIEDSSIYSMLSDKLDEINEHEEELKEKVKINKDKYNIDNDKLRKIKDKYYDFNGINQRLKEIIYDQAYILADLKYKVMHAETEIKKVTYKINTMSDQCGKLLKDIDKLSVIPGLRSATAVATMTAYYIYFMKNVKDSPIEKKVNKEIVIRDYSSDIEKNLNKINDAYSLLSKTTKKLKKEIAKFKEEYGEYQDEVPEVDRLLKDMNIVLDSVKFKEKEIKALKSKQANLLQENKERVYKAEQAKKKQEEQKEKEIKEQEQVKQQERLKKKEEKEKKEKQKILEKTNRDENV